jgi:class 3 adenylate cyclase
MSDLTTWLDGWGLAQLAPRLAEQDIDLDALQYLTEDDLKELGLTIGLRRHLLRAIEQGLRRPAVEAASSAGDRPGANQAAERRQLTILFSDLAATTELSSRHDPERWASCCTHTRRAAPPRSSFTAARSRGSAVTASWPISAIRRGTRTMPSAPSAPPSASCATCRNCVRSVTSRSACASELRPVMIGEGESGQVDVVGETPNLAARLQAQASPNGIVISAGTQRLVRGLFNCASLGAMQLKGFPTPVPVWEVHGESAAESRFDARHARAVTPMVGRERELGLLMGCWERAAAGDAQVAQITGEAGVGKSRMLRALRTALEPSRPNVLSLYCSAYHQASALHPVVNYYERLAGIVHNDAAEQRLAKLETLLRSSGTVLEQTVPIVASLLSIPLGDRYAPLRLTPEQLKERTLELLIQRIRDSALQQPVLCLVEDVHWIDPTLSQLISRMIAALKTLPVFLIVTSRTPAETLWLQDETALTHLSLARLDRAQAETLLRHSVGGRAMSREVSAEIIERADGIPLFVEELSKTVVEFAVADAGSDAGAARGRGAGDAVRLADGPPRPDVAVSR